MAKAGYILGCDESGTGAWAGPFTVCAYLAEIDKAPMLQELGARDSKTLTHARRVALVDELAACSTLVGLAVVPPTYTDQKAAWRRGFLRAIRGAYRFFDRPRAPVEIVIDGSYDAALSSLVRDHCGRLPTFLPKADAKVPHVAAASILAKVHRSELMHEAHSLYPEYGWSSSTGHGNDGYGTRAHRLAIEAHGVCELHRRVRPLLPFFDGQKASEAAT